MMLRIDHRESHDVDIFISDPQALPFLDPQKHDFLFEVPPTDFEGDGSNFQRLSFADIGEIDFILSRALTKPSSTRATVENESILLETIPEIIAKKIYYRGASIKPRDIFDIAAAAESHSDSVVEALRAYRNQVAIALQTIDRLNAEFVNNAILQLAIKDRFRPIAIRALSQARQLLQAV